jgi:hypothetical protein
MYAQEQMQDALRNPAKCAEYATNLAQTYFEMHSSMSRGNPVDFNLMHTVNNQLTALVIESGKQIFLTATIDNIQKQQTKLESTLTEISMIAAPTTNQAEQTKSAVGGETSTLTTGNVVSINATAATNDN